MILHLSHKSPLLPANPFRLHCNEGFQPIALNLLGLDDYHHHEDLVVRQLNDHYDDPRQTSRVSTAGLRYVYHHPEEKFCNRSVAILTMTFTKPLTDGPLPRN